MANHFVYQKTTVNVGDLISVQQKIVEEGKTRTQAFDGLVIGVKGRGVNKTFTVRKIATGAVGVERIYPLDSPNILAIKVKTRGRVRRAKLNYIRQRVGRQATRVKESRSSL